MKFKLIKDLILNTGFEEELILKKDETIEPNEKGEYFFEKLNRTYLKEDLLSKLDIFKPIEEIDLKIQEIDQNDEDKIGNWRIQLDIKVSRKKLKEIETFIKESVSKML
jgi:hypothetical protein